MNGPSLVFLPYEISLSHDLGRLSTTILISGNESKQLTFNALAISFAADVSVDRLFVHTANSDHADSASLICISLSTAAELWRVASVPPGGEIKLHASDHLVDAGLPYGTGDPFIVRVTYDGEVIQRNYRSGYEMVRAAKSALDEGNIDFAEELFIKALTTSISPSTKAGVLRSLGEIAESNGRIEDAIGHYEQALSINPRVGVKRRLDRLREERRCR